MRLPIKQQFTLNDVCDWFVAFQRTGHAVKEIQMPKKALVRVQKVAADLMVDDYLLGARMVKNNSLQNEVEVLGF